MSSRRSKVYLGRCRDAIRTGWLEAGFLLSGVLHLSDRRFVTVAACSRCEVNQLDESDSRSLEETRACDCPAAAHVEELAGRSGERIQFGQSIINRFQLFLELEIFISF